MAGRADAVSPRPRRPLTAPWSELGTSFGASCLQKFLNSAEGTTVSRADWRYHRKHASTQNPGNEEIVKVDILATDNPARMRALSREACLQCVSPGKDGPVGPADGPGWQADALLYLGGAVCGQRLRGCWEGPEGQP